MKKRYVAALAAVLSVAAGAPSARADYIPADQAPPQIARFVPVARAYWPNSPCTGREEIELVPIAQMTGRYGDALLDGTCHIQLEDDLVNWDLSEYVCNIVVHEFGHLALGDNAFADVNPGEPWHSPDPTSIMTRYASDVNFAPCAAAAGGWQLADAAERLLRDTGYAPTGFLDAVSCRDARSYGETLCTVSRRGHFRVVAGQVWQVQAVKVAKAAKRRTPHRHKGRRGARRVSRHEPGWGLGRRKV